MTLDLKSKPVVSNTQALQERIRELEQQLLDKDHELALFMDKYHAYPWCCDYAAASHGWHHMESCKKYVVTD